MDQSAMLSILGGIYDKLVSDVTTAVINQLNASGQAQIALDSEAFKDAVCNVLDTDSTARETIRDIAGDAMNSYDLTDNDDFRSLVSKIDEMEEITVDADDDNFADAVRSVIRNHI